LSAEQIGLWAGFVLTLMIFSYVLGDNFLYRLAVYVFVGLSAGFITMITVESVILPWLRATLLATNPAPENVVLGLVPLLLGILLLMKMTNRLGRLGNLGLAYIIGVGAAVAVIGAISGTLLPLAGATANSVRQDTLNGFLIVLGVISTLVYFQYLARREQGGQARREVLVRAIGSAGHVVIVITLGALYGGAILSGLAVFSERIAFIVARISGG
jgi:hypothetical protein